MDRGLQERLVGAAVLVALGVWLIPWVLDGSAADDDSPAQPVALKLPAPEQTGGGVVRRQTIELDTDRGAALKGAAAEPEADEEVVAGVAHAAAPAESQNAAQPSEADAPPAPQPDAMADARSEVAALPQAGEVSAPTAKSSGPSLPDIVAAAPVVGWMVQLGSFSDAGNARRQAQRVDTFGHDARIYEFAAAGGRTMFRVRVGPLETRERAEAAASALAAHGFVAQVVAPE